jgi:energy-converting hydrogenase A subunit M
MLGHGVEYMLMFVVVVEVSEARKEVDNSVIRWMRIGTTHVAYNVVYIRMGKDLACPIDQVVRIIKTGNVETSLGKCHGMTSVTAAEIKDARTAVDTGDVQHKLN